MSTDSDESNFVLTKSNLISNCTPHINDIQLDESNEFLVNSFELHCYYCGDSSYSYESFCDSDFKNYEENEHYDSECRLDFKLRE